MAIFGKNKTLTKEEITQEMEYISGNHERTARKLSGVVYACQAVAFFAFALSIPQAVIQHEIKLVVFLSIGAASLVIPLYFVASQNEYWANKKKLEEIEEEEEEAKEEGADIKVTKEKTKNEETDKKSVEDSVKEKSPDFVKTTREPPKDEDTSKTDSKPSEETVSEEESIPSEEKDGEPQDKQDSEDKEKDKPEDTPEKDKEKHADKNGLISEDKENDNKDKAT